MSSGSVYFKSATNYNASLGVNVSKRTSFYITYAAKLEKVSALYSTPFTRHYPVNFTLLVLATRAERIFNNDVFPAPDAPKMAVTSPPGQKPSKFLRISLLSRFELNSYVLFDQLLCTQYF